MFLYIIECNSSTVLKPLQRGWVCSRAAYGKAVQKEERDYGGASVRGAVEESRATPCMSALHTTDRYLLFCAMVFVTNSDFHWWMTANFIKQKKMYFEIPTCVSCAQNICTVFS